MVALSLNQRRQITQRLILFTIFWGLSIGYGSYFGLFRTFPAPLFALLVAIGIAAPVVAYYRNAAFRDYIRALPLNDLTVFHLWRIPAALIFFYYGHHQLLPQTFVDNAAWGDLITGILVLPVLMRPRNRWKYWAFHLFGLGDLMIAVGTGLIFTLLQVPAMETITTFPIALIPAFGVGISGASHIMALDILARRKAKIS